MTETLRIEELGAQGDGVAFSAKGPVYVPFTLPGERVTIQMAGSRATDAVVEEPSPRRVAPVCAHFGQCGGCKVQHIDQETYAEWKREKVVQALKSRGLDAEVKPLVRVSPATRRRLALTARRTAGGMLLGINTANANNIINVDKCPVAEPGIVAALPDLRQLAAIVCATKKPFRLLVTATRTGLDVAIEGAGATSEKQRRRAVTLVLQKGFARLALDGEVIVEAEKPAVLFGNVPVALPVGGFLQAVPEAEAAMATLLTEFLDGFRHAVDLFAGSGTFALRLAANGRVHAVEGDAAAIAALSEAARSASRLKPVTAERRDLFHRPLTAKELDAFDALVFDPPRAGAEAQSRQIARSSVERVAAVSCNPGTLARDLAILVAGGFRIVSVTPIDQFLWSAHVEAVALLERVKR